MIPVAHLGFYVVEDVAIWAVLLLAWVLGARAWLGVLWFAALVKERLEICGILGGGACIYSVLLLQEVDGMAHGSLISPLSD